MKKTLLTLTSLLITAALATTSFAEGNKEGKEGKPGMAGGKVTAVADGTITVKNKSAGEQTFKTSPETKITKADGTAATASDIKVGSMVKITAGTTPDQAAKIKLIEPKKKEGKPEAATPAPPKTTE